MFWTLIEKGNRFGLYQCICGNRKTVRNRDVEKGLSKSCGCKRGYRKKETKKEFLKRIFSKCEKKDECILWCGVVTKGGYAVSSYDSKHILVHRKIYELHKGKIAPRLKILHSCDNPNCLNIEHLRAGTQKENMDDMRSRKRENFLKGFNHPLSKVNLHMVNQIKYLYEREKLSQDKISYYLGISQNSVSKILAGKHHIFDEYSKV